MTTEPGSPVTATHRPPESQQPRQSPSVATPVFLTGHPKSGTTLLLSLLDGHSELNVFPKETLFFEVGRAELEADPLAGVDRFVERIFDGVLFGMDQPPDSSVDPGTYKREVLKRWETTDFDISRFLEISVATFGDLTGQVHRRYWVEKTPRTELHIPTLAEWYPNAKLIYVVRDPRANYAAYQRWATRLGYPSDFARFASRWTQSIRAARGNAERLPQIVVRYEDLVSNTSETMKRLCDFLSIAIEDTLLQPTLEGVPFSGNSIYDQTFVGISQSSLTHWQQVLGDRRIREIEWLLRREIAELDYPFQSGPTSGLPSLRALRECATISYYRLYDRLPPWFRGAYVAVRARLLGRVPRAI